MYDTTTAQWLQQKVTLDPSMSHTHARYVLNNSGAITHDSSQHFPFIIPQTAQYIITASLQVTQVSSNRKFDGLKFRLFLFEENLKQPADRKDYYFSEEDLNDDVTANRWILWDSAAPVAIDGIHTTSAHAHFSIPLIAGRVLRPWVI